MTISPWATGAMKVAVFSAAFAIPGTGIAMAAGPISATSGNGSILGGNQINLPVSAPVDICGNGAGIRGLAAAGSAETTTASSVGSSSGGLLPTTGADLAGMLVAGLGAIGAGAVSMVAIRRRRVAGRD